MYTRYRSMINKLHTLIYNYIDLRILRIIIAAIMYSISLIRR